jgi:hypothetical protein
MKKHEAIQLLKLMRVPADTIDYSNGWVKSSCPLAPATHSGGTDENPSFGIKISDDLSYYNCFSCGHGTVSGLIHRFNFEVEYIGAVNKYYGDTQYSIDGSNRLDYEDKFSQTVSETVQKPVPVEYLDKYPLLEEAIGAAALRVREWLLCRGIALEVAYQYQTRFDVYGNVIFPMIGPDGTTIYALQFRSTADKKFWYFKDEISGEEFPKGAIWYGHQTLTGDSVLLVESQTDVLRLKTLGVKMPVLASCGSVTHGQLNSLYQKDYYIGYDADNSGEQKKRRTIFTLQSSAQRIFVLDWSTVLRNDPGDLGSRNELTEVYNNRLLLKGGDEILKDIGYKETFEPNKQAEKI